MKNLSLTDKIIVSRLLRKIKDGSLQNILRSVIFSETESVEEILKRERPELRTNDIEKLKMTDEEYIKSKFIK